MFVRLYWILPALATLTWASMLMGMLITWAVDDNEVVYPAESEGQTIPYISDIGAYKLQPLFIAMATVTVVLLDAGMIAERWLRHNGRLAPNTSRFQKFLSVMSIIFAIAGAAGIILLSIFDTKDHPRLHDIFLGVFLGGYVISAVFICWEYQRLGIHFRQHRILRASFWLKLAFILIEIAMAIAFGVSEYKGKYNLSAIFEWILAFIYTGYVATFVVDLFPAVKTKHHMSHPAVAELQNGTNGHGTNGHGTNGHGTNGHGTYTNGNNGYANDYPSGYTNGNTATNY